MIQPTSSAQEDAQSHSTQRLNNDEPRYTNVLINETSPYLRQHAHNPVQWYPWGAEAFEAARSSGKLIFLSVGYSTCYWCHVMERQVFENPKLAAILNEHCVSIKVDREERPDVDDIYMTAVQLISGRGGWPMSVFLTPPGANGEKDLGLKPIWAGTYIPPEPHGQMPGFAQVVEGISQAWTTEPQAILQQADRVTEAVQKQLGQTEPQVPLGRHVIQNASNQLLRIYDEVHGGFGAAPKFPQPSNLLFLLKVYQNNEDDSLGSALSLTLERMARGGMYDQVGGGFHRYSTDERWLVPHFEKMLYDNGQLVEAYLAAQAIRPDAKDKQLYERVVRESCDYVLREMTDPTGLFWSAQDAEVNAREGENYVWTPQLLRDALADSPVIDLALRMYGLDKGTNFQDPHHRNDPSSNVLYLPERLDELAKQEDLTLQALVHAKQNIDQQLLAARQRRPQPATDDKAIVAWNGIMIAALAQAGDAFDHSVYTQAAAKAATYILQNMRIKTQGDSDDGQSGLFRTMRHGRNKIPAFLEDYAFFVHGLIALHQATGEAHWLQSATALTSIATNQFGAAASHGGGYYDTLANQSDLFVRTLTTYDGALPSGNSQMIHNLLDLYKLTKEPAYLNQAISDLKSFSGALARRGASMVHMQHALLKAYELAPDLLNHDTSEPPPTAQTPNGPVAVTLNPDKVDLSSGSARVAVTIKIEKGYHLNASESNLSELIATSLELSDRSQMTMSVEYPPGVLKQYPFADRALNVYEGTVVLKATLHRTGEKMAANQQPHLMLRYQACTETTCLETQEITLPMTIGP